MTVLNCLNAPLTVSCVVWVRGLVQIACNSRLLF